MRIFCNKKNYGEIGSQSFPLSVIFFNFHIVQCFFTFSLMMLVIMRRIDVLLKHICIYVYYGDHHHISHHFHLRLQCGGSQSPSSPLSSPLLYSPRLDLSSAPGLICLFNISNIFIIFYSPHSYPFSAPGYSSYIIKLYEFILLYI